VTTQDIDCWVSVGIRIDLLGLRLGEERPPPSLAHETKCGPNLKQIKEIILTLEIDKDSYGRHMDLSDANM